jgi:hypothetical protein
LNEQSLNDFLSSYRLKAKHYWPRSSLIEPDIIINDSLKNKKDNLAAFCFSEEKQANHVAIVQDFKDPKILLLDPDIQYRITDIYSLVNSMRNDSRCGFYIIG